MFLRCRLVHMYIQIVHLINHSSLVCGQEVEFLADSGATHSVLCSDSLFPQAVLSEKFTHSGFASGTVQRENFTVAPSCVEGQGQKFRHGSLWSDLCPVNLLARDLMCKLNINCISCHDVITLTQSNWSYDGEILPRDPGFRLWMEAGRRVACWRARGCMPPEGPFSQQLH